MNTNYESQTKTPQFPVGIIFVTIAVEVVLVWILMAHVDELKAEGLSSSIQAAVALLIGWPTLVFVVAAFYAALRSAHAARTRHTVDPE